MVLLLMAGSAVFSADAQSLRLLPVEASTVAMKDAPVQPRSNRVKLNMAGLAARNYSLQYERVLSKRVSVALSYRTMLSGKVPFQNTLLNAVASDQDTKNALQNLQISGSAITPEVGYYVCRKGLGITDNE